MPPWDRSSSEQKQRKVVKQRERRQRRKIEGTHVPTTYRKINATAEDYDRFFLLQQGRCAICSKVPKRRLDLDHDHETGELRGLLCWSCNTKLGWFEKWKKQVLRYLQGRENNNGDS